MKHTEISMCLLLCLVPALAQDKSETQTPAARSSDQKVSAQQSLDDEIKLMRQDVRSQKKQIVAANLPLTDAESTRFWPVYDRYAVDHSKIYDMRYALIKEYAKSYNSMTDEQAHDFTKRLTNTDEDMAQLRMKWIPEFEKVISAKKTAMFFQIDRRVGLMVELSLSSEIPLAKQ